MFFFSKTLLSRHLKKNDGSLYYACFYLPTLYVAFLTLLQNIYFLSVTLRSGTVTIVRWFHPDQFLIFVVFICFSCSTLQPFSYICCIQVSFWECCFISSIPGADSASTLERQLRSKNWCSEIPYEKHDKYSNENTIPLWIK